MTKPKAQGPAYAVAGRFSTGSSVSAAPYDVTVTTSGKVAVGLPGPNGNGVVTVFTSTGKVIRSFTTGSVGDNIDAGPGDTVFVSNYSAHTIEKCSITGSCVTAWDNPDDPGSFNPSGVAFNSAGQIWIVNQALDVVHRRTPNGSDVGGPGSGPGQLDSPGDVSYGAGSMYVLDYGNSRVERFNATSGAYQGAWGQPGDGPNQFHHPTAVTVSGSTVVSLDDYLSSNSELQFNTLSGGFLGTKLVPVTYAMGIAGDAQGDLYVAGKLGGSGGYGVLKLSPLGSAKVAKKKVHAAKNHKTAKVVMKCAGAGACTGKVVLTQKNKKGPKLAKGKYSIAKGHKAKVKVKLTKKGKKALKKQRKVKVLISWTTPSGKKLKKGVLLRR